MIRTGCVLLAIGLGLAACGNTAEERGITGAGIGAAGGAVLGAVTGLSVVEGALIGAGAVGLTGALTDKSDIDIGDPIWDRGDDQAAAAPAAPTATAALAPAAVSGPQLVRDIQSGLARMGYDPGPIDGVMGPRTRDAIRQYQGQHGLLVDGQASQALATHIRTTGGTAQAEAATF
ncbi:MAG TPA: peptidoglycan-binding domain-containing protein [Alphaproteobacteria bacterium]